MAEKAARQVTTVWNVFECATATNENATNAFDHHRRFIFTTEICFKTFVLWTKEKADDQLAAPARLVWPIWRARNKLTSPRKPEKKKAAPRTWTTRKMRIISLSRKKPEKFVIWMWPNELSCYYKSLLTHLATWPVARLRPQAGFVSYCCIPRARGRGLSERNTRRSQNWRGVTVSGAKVDPGSTQMLLLLTVLGTRKNAFRKAVCLLLNNIIPLIELKNWASKNGRSVFVPTIFRIKLQYFSSEAGKRIERSGPWLLSIIHAGCLCAGVLLKSPLLAASCSRIGNWHFDETSAALN